MRNLSGRAGNALGLKFRVMDFDPGEDHEARQLALIREQRPIVAALRSMGYPIDFLFSPPAGPLSDAARALLEEFLDTPLSLETKLMISDLIEATGGSVTREGYAAPSRPASKDR
ncbi:MAG: hypothetical protein K0Q92_3349 [Steroidobacteraceae bacterium]|nr:hypothetical protein [Steroidobacteraceae bacterium]